MEAMSLIRDLVYGFILAMTAPVWLWYLLRTGKARTDWAARFGRTHLAPTHRPTILIHAVSVGEVNAIRGLVERLTERYRDDVRIVVSATTNTGVARARQLFEKRHDVVRYPFDFSWAVRRFLRQVQPEVVALVELELWPSFLAACDHMNTPVIVINGRLSERSFRRYRRFRFAVRSMFGRLSHAGVQDTTYAHRFTALGTPADRVHVTGSMKWDNARIVDQTPGADGLGQALGIRRDRPLVVCGSTGPGEEMLFRDKLAGLTDAQGRPVQLLIAPRKPERFDEAADALGPCVRRSRPDTPAPDDGRLFLLDTLGELADAYALADVVIIGRSFSPQYGSDMTEPIALGKPVVIGPNVADFADMLGKFLAGDGILQVHSPEALREAVEHLLHDRRRGQELAANGRRVIRDNQGATQRHVELIESVLPQCGRG